MVIVGVLFMHKKEAIAHLFSMRVRKIMKSVLHFEKWWRVPIMLSLKDSKQVRMDSYSQSNSTLIGQ